MKWLLIIVVVFSLLTIFELNKEYKKGSLSQKVYTIIAMMEGVTALLSLALFFAM